MTKILFSDNAWNEYCCWQTQDKKTLKKIYMLLRDIDRNSFEGLGKPEPLKNKFNGFWSRRIDDVNRLVYRKNDNYIEVVQCKGHYE